MTAKSMIPYVEGSSAIRAMFEEGAKLVAKYGAENVFDFSLGNPSVPAPPELNQAIKEVLEEEDSLVLHGYNKSNSGYTEVRQAVAEHLNKEHGTKFTYENIIMTVGVAGGMNVILKVLVDPGEELLVFAPFFAEYSSYAKNHGIEMKVVPPNTDGSGSESGIPFQPNLAAAEKMISENTRAVLINSPNNPSGVIYSEETIKALANILKAKSEEFGNEIYLIADEPYRDLAYDGAEVPFVTKYYDNTVVGYSWSKSLSLPGERIGYLVIPSEITDFEGIIPAINTIQRVLGFVNAPSLMQKAVAKCLDCKCDISVYDRNRKALYNGLTEAGFECTYPQGAFYMFVKSPYEDEIKFVDKAREHNILIVPGTGFGCPGYVRMAYCIEYDTIKRATPKFKELMEDIKKDIEGNK